LIRGIRAGGIAESATRCRLPGARQS
jgi:hypothetical protein